MNKYEAEQWDRRNRDLSDWHRRTQIGVKITVELTPDEFERVARDADWEGCTVSEYLRRAALGELRRGC